jgi:hypothetical protein
MSSLWFLNKLFYTVQFRKSVDDAVAHLHQVITHREIGLDEGPEHYIENIQKLLSDDNALRETHEQSVVGDMLSLEKAKKILEGLLKELVAEGGA